jgi:hypothetical protein
MSIGGVFSCGEADIDGQWAFRDRRSGTKRRVSDPLGRVAVGDPDPGTNNGHQKCGFAWVDQTLPLLILHWCCTRERGHPGQHLAGTGEVIAAVHPPALAGVPFWRTDRC